MRSHLKHSPLSAPALFSQKVFMPYTAEIGERMFYSLWKQLKAISKERWARENRERLMCIY